MVGNTAANPPENQSARRLTQLAAATAALGLDLSADTLQRLMAYLGLLQRWNKVYNLTALRDPDEMLSLHLIDCLAALPALRRQVAGLGDGGVRVLDVGSGGGLPGVVLAIAQPGWQVSCVDSVAKKSSFIRQVAADLRLGNLRGLHARVESLYPDDSQYGVITSRAFASLADFTSLSQHLLAEQGVWMAMKGRDPQDEQAQLPPGVQVFHVEQLQVPSLDAQRCLVWMRRTGD
jgi:16S rRNA (guanine527-N7)-methyltransferase